MLNHNSIQILCVGLILALLAGENKQKDDSGKLGRDARDWNLVIGKSSYFT